MLVNRLVLSIHLVLIRVTNQSPFDLNVSPIKEPFASPNWNFKLATTKSKGEGGLSILAKALKCGTSSSSFQGRSVLVLWHHVGQNSPRMGTQYRLVYAGNPI